MSVKAVMKYVVMVALLFAGLIAAGVGLFKSEAVQARKRGRQVVQSIVKDPAAVVTVEDLDNYLTRDFLLYLKVSKPGEPEKIYFVKLFGRRGIGIIPLFNTPGSFEVLETELVDMPKLRP